jgi:16S rRNA (uracil1498-N3)-methyltransferase
MSKPRLYCPELGLGEVILSREESHHAAHVLRLRPGDGVVVFDGRGLEAEATLKGMDRGAAIVAVGEVRGRAFELRHRITLAVAMGRQHRQGYLVEKCTELGVAAIQPISAERSVTRAGDHAVEKWSKRAVEAAKQSGRAWVPVVHSPLTFAEIVGRIGAFSAAFVADVGVADVEGRRGELGVRSWLSALSGQREGAELLVLVGPEGGWTDQERAVAAAAGVESVGLGPTVLRTETAAVAVCAVAASVSMTALPDGRR